MQQLRARRREQTVQLHWRLLISPAEQLGQQVEQLMQLLAGLSHQQVVRLVCAEPRMLGRDPAQLLSTVEALEQVRQGAKHREHASCLTLSCSFQNEF
jgi:hypothetical protein